MAISQPRALGTFAVPDGVFTSSTSAKCLAKKSISPGKAQVPPSDQAPELPTLSSEKLQKIFSQQFDPEEGNQILEEIQEARIQGKLDEGIRGVPQSTVAEGLAWLRTAAPLDEDAAIIARLDREDQEQSQEFIARAVKLGIYSPQLADELSNQPIQSSGDAPLVYIPQQNAAENARYGKSAFDELRKRNKRRQELREKRQQLAEERERKRAVKLGLPATVEEKRVAQEQRRLVKLEEVRRSKDEYVEATRNVFGSGLDSWPAKKTWQRLWPSFALTLGILGFSALFATYYVTPPDSARMFPEIPPAQATVGALIAFQFVIFCAWHTTVSQRFLYRNFVSLPGAPRLSGLLGNTFSHQTFSHLISNMGILYFFGTWPEPKEIVHDDIGRGAFLATYCSCGAVSTLASLSMNAYKKIFSTGALGASGVISGLVAAYLYLNQDKSVKIWFIPEEYTKHLSTLVVLVVLTAIDIDGLRRGTLRRPFWNVDWLSHLGGTAAGIACGVFIRETRKRQKQNEGNVDMKRGAKDG
ncbi:MAG: hypothetical protein Q9191_003306 [Dirinaria sp. TL-2023a]